ncbi:hypothetical protein GCM10007216_06400 [Thalassobacillus devorans]|uniref:Uncharacterized protein n=1 Tax=Thalassobacillus devorans TaxID=279813 RepID=A0ABQ1NJB2_9BACI|nr:hypothetical protein [Thalassobacillus devorans]NIK27551.1 hypothetical protein [Thalassobacillus devorans]GGC78632.1 hypothetical protein GCM10007216_06400 [Thalassobacillus devorans]
MNWLSLIGVSLVVLLLFLYEWSKMDHTQVKEKRTFIFLLAGVWLIAVMLIFFPDVSGPIDLITFLFRPMENFL